MDRVLDHPDDGAAGELVTYSVGYDMFNQTTASGDGTIDNQTNPPYRRNEDLAKIEIAVQSLIFALAIIGNILVLVVLGQRSGKLSRMNLLIVHLSLADLFVAFFNVLPQLIWDVTLYFYGNDFLCRFVKYVQVLGMYASSYVLVTTAIDRYLAICRPLTSHVINTKWIHLLVLVAWVLSMLFSIPQVFIFSLHEVSPLTYNCWAQFDPPWTLQLYITWFTMAVYVVPLILLTTTYSYICATVWRSTSFKEPSLRFKGKTHTNGYGTCSKPDRTSQTYKRVLTVDAKGKNRLNPRAHTSGRSALKSKIKTIKLTLTVIICYFVCWAPFFVAQMWAAWDANAPFEDEAMVIILLLASLNSCTNPWIYLAFSDKLESHLRKLLCLKRKPRWHRRGTWSSASYNRSSMASRGTDLSRTDSINQHDVITLDDLNNDHKN